MMEFGKTRQVLNAHCIGCGRTVDAATGINHDQPPSAGDVTICLRCGQVMVFADDLKLRNPTDDEMIAIAGNPEIVTFNRLRTMMKP